MCFYCFYKTNKMSIGVERLMIDPNDSKVTWLYLLAVTLSPLLQRHPVNIIVITHSQYNSNLTWWTAGYYSATKISLTPEMFGRKSCIHKYISYFLVRGRCGPNYIGDMGFIVLTGLILTLTSISVVTSMFIWRKEVRAAGF